MISSRSSQKLNSKIQKFYTHSRWLSRDFVSFLWLQCLNKYLGCFNQTKWAKLGRLLVGQDGYIVSVGSMKIVWDLWFFHHTHLENQLSKYLNEGLIFLCEDGVVGEEYSSFRNLEPCNNIHQPENAPPALWDFFFFPPKTSNVTAEGKVSFLVWRKFSLYFPEVSF